jgi:hypothetical protein
LALRPTRRHNLEPSGNPRQKRWFQLFSPQWPQVAQPRCPSAIRAVFLNTGIGGDLNHTVGHTNDGIGRLTGRVWSGTPRTEMSA